MSRSAASALLEADEVRVVTLDSGASPSVRAAVRVLLASITGIPEASLEIMTGAKGKPLLRPPSNVHFSVSHAENVSMVAITHVGAIGVDIERVRAVPKAAEILKRFFPPEAIAEILSADDRDLRFVEAWTRAEATVKVRGASVWEVATPDDGVVVRMLGAPDGFAAAVAVAAIEWRINQVTVSLEELGMMSVRS